MRRRVSAACFALALCAACGTGPAALPDWLVALTHQLESQPVANPPASIARYAYKGRVVYYLPPHCCDIPSDLYDARGVLICHPDGGLSGIGDARCPDFLAERTKEQIVWRDPRGGA